MPCLPVLQSGKVCSNEPRTGIVRLESVDASHYGHSESLFLSTTYRRYDTEWLGVEDGLTFQGPPIGTENNAWGGGWNGAGNIWVLNVTGMQDLIMIKQLMGVKPVLLIFFLSFFY